eukprot:Gregarina_sp_Poly_1__48@NODE_100_length_14458_cov_232_622472_g87_i0_p12_GENE_NODE_100_length_14458_cov_232_622472_g87_i0NODE_100_length_14458_cov_232_622472_g87_i0_p12_ORF_typecomplete_len134_score13_93OSTbeta/PF15048_6/11OSTbeta/PF15048_6/26_NODE_100_length_14458_cov_232_622472_g87_i0321722
MTPLGARYFEDAWIWHVSMRLLTLIAFILLTADVGSPHPEEFVVQIPPPSDPSSESRRKPKKKKKQSSRSSARAQNTNTINIIVQTNGAAAGPTPPPDQILLPPVPTQHRPSTKTVSWRPVMIPKWRALLHGA